MTKRSQIYKCEVCGNIVEVHRAGTGALWCCMQGMSLYKESTSDAMTEKGESAIEETGGGYKVTVGSAVREQHHLEWIELSVGGQVQRKYLNPDEKPEAVFHISSGEEAARAYRNLHGLWKA